MSDRHSEAERRVTHLELSFDLVFVFAITQVTAFLADDLTWGASCADCSSSPRSGGPGPRTPGSRIRSTPKRERFGLPCRRGSFTVEEARRIAPRTGRNPDGDDST